MAPEVQTRSGLCPTHGTVLGTRELPKIEFPFLYYAVARALAKRKPFRCPQCSDPIELGPSS